MQNLLITLCLMLLGALVRAVANATLWALFTVVVGACCLCCGLVTLILAPVLPGMTPRRRSGLLVSLPALAFLGLALPGSAQTTVTSENFDGVVAPALPSTLDFVGSNFVTSTTNPKSAPNELTNSTTGQKDAYTLAKDGVNGDSSIQADIAFAAVGGSDLAQFPLRSAAQSFANQYFVQFKGNGSVLLFWRNSATSTQIGSTVTITGGLTASAYYHLLFKAVGTTLTVTVTRYSDGDYLNSSGTWQASAANVISATDSNIAGQGYGGVSINNASANRVEVDNLLFQSNASLAVAQPTLSSFTSTSVTLAASVTGGVAPYTYQWYRANAANFTPGSGNLLSGTTSATPTDSTLAAGTVYYYKVVVTDNAANSATSAALMARTGTLPNTLQIVCFGDSIGKQPVFLTGDFPFYMSQYLQTLGGFRSVRVLNCHISGSDTSTAATGWQPTATSSAAAGDNTNLSPLGGNYLTAAESYVAAQFPSGPVYWITELGRNDALSNVSAATYQSNLSAIVANILAANPNYHVILNAPITSSAIASSWSDAKTDLVVSYQAAQAALVSGTSVLVGDTGQTYQWMSENFSTLYQSDGVHPVTNGAILMGLNYAFWDLKALNASIYGTSTPARRVIH